VNAANWRMHEKEINMKMMKNVFSLFWFALALFAANPVAAQIPSDGLVGYWPFTGNANDASGNGNHGTVNGATLTTDRFGNVNSAYSFDGNDRINFSLIDLSAYNQMSMDIWIFPTNYYTGYWFEQDFMRQQGAANPDFLLGFQNHGGLLSFGLGFQNGFYSELDVPVNGGSLLNSWHHVAATFDGITKKLFLDGNLIGTEIVSGNAGSNFSYTTTEAGYFIGATGNVDYFGGKLDDGKIYARALSFAEVSNLYTTQSSEVQTP